MKWLWLFGVLSLFPIKFYAQDYFQQEVDYVIKVKLDDYRHELSGNVRIIYKNNSPDELGFIWFHIWPNAYKNSGTAMGQQHLENGDYDFYNSSEFERGYIDSLDFIVDGKKVKWEYHPDHIDICKVLLEKPLKPGKKITISTDFHVKIPDGRFSRLGHVGQSYQITQWYPKPAVYDKNGWHEMPYLTMGEFYSEFGSFDVQITVPENYVVGATGDLQNKSEMKWLLDKASETQKKIEEKTLYSKDSKKRDNSFPESSEEYKTLRYVQSKVHDFAWFADKRYHVLTDTMHLPHSKRVVRCWSMFTNNEAHLWEKSLEYLKDGTYYYSLWNGDYPYDQVTAVDGTISAGGGMEYPNITVIGASFSDRTLETTIVHEVGHNWFYGILGSNEREHAWMDEGINTLNENRYLETKYPDESAIQGFIPFNKKLMEKFSLDILKQKSIHEISYLISAKKNYDQPIELPSDQYTQLNYGGIVYSKTGLVFDYLKGYLGDDLFDKCMHEYFNRWKFKHPQPEDLRKVFEDLLERDMSWFFEDVLKTTKTIDHKIISARKTEWGDYLVKVRSKGEINGPFALGGIRNDSVVVYQWYDSIPESGRVNFPDGNYSRIVLDPMWETPELTRDNNTLRMKGITRRTEPIKFQPIAGLENPYKTTIYWLPLIGWNQHDGVMTGLMFHNITFPQNKFEYVLTPGFGWTSANLIGGAMMAYNFPTSYNSIFQNIRVELNTRRFSYSDADDPDDYISSSGKIDFELRRKRLRYSPQQHIQLEYKNVNRNLQVDQTDQFARGTYSIFKAYPFYTIGANVNLKYGQNTFGGEMFNAELIVRNRFFYSKSRKMIDLRIYGSWFPYINSIGIAPNWASTLSGRNGNYDYSFDEWYLGRSAVHPNMLSQQMVVNSGGFKVYSPVVSDQWMTTANLTVQLMQKINLSVFGDIGFYPVETVTTGGSTISNEFSYDAGLKIAVIRGFVNIYVPLIYSERINNYYELYNYAFFQKIRFDINIRGLNLLKQIGNVGG